MEVNEEATLKSWKVTLTAFDFYEQYSEDDFSYFEPAEEDSQYLIASLKVENTGTEADTFLSSFTMGDDITVNVKYKEEYLYPPTQLLGSSTGILNQSCNPLATLNGTLAFALPNTVINSEDPLVLDFQSGSEHIYFSLR